MTLLISPLLALMRNQVEAAQRVGIRCATINSANFSMWKDIEVQVERDEVDLLLVSPERLRADRFRENIIKKSRIGLLVIDEAHCISDWGHDFRPDYREISRLLKYLPRNVPLLATTATATSRVIEDVQSQLGDGVEVSRGSLVRKSLFLQNICLESLEKKLAWLAQELTSGKLKDGAGIIYTHTKQDAKIVSRWLLSKGITAFEYSSSCYDKEFVENKKCFPPSFREELESQPEWKDFKKQNDLYREFLERLLLEDRIRVLVATSALSMGFDKPNLKFVIHYQRPKSVIDYYQQVGRAGRAIENAYGVLLSSDDDDEVVNYFIRTAFPSEGNVKKVLACIREGSSTMSQLLEKCNISRKNMDMILKFLMTEESQPIVKVGSNYHAGQSLNGYKFPKEMISHITQVRENEKQVMKDYVGTSDCLMHFLCKELESPMNEVKCGHCASCCPDLALSTNVDAKLVDEATEFLIGKPVRIFPKKIKDGDSIYKTEEGRALSYYGIGKWGRLVSKGKYLSTRFDDQLVEACAKMIEKMIEKWKEREQPKWIVPVPSRRNNELVGNFAERLAKRLKLPCFRGLEKNKDTEPQKTMANSEYQKNNVKEVFVVNGKVPVGGCFLVDDMVDSGWTLAYAGVALIKVGAKFVIPIALADSSNKID